MPSLFFLAVITLSFQHIVDKILITYYFEARPSHDTEMSWKIIKSLKYAAIPYLSIGGFAI